MVGAKEIMQERDGVARQNRMGVSEMTALMDQRTQSERTSAHEKKSSIQVGRKTVE